MTLTTLPFDNLLDLAPWVGQRSATFVFDLVDGATGENLGTVNPVRDPPPVLSHDTSRTIKRQVSNFELGAADTARVNVVTARILISMVVGGRSYPLGRYMFIDQTRVQYTSGVLSNAALVDEMFIVDQPITASYSANSGIGDAGALVNVALHQVLDPLPVAFTAEVSPFFTIGSWPIGTSRGRLVEEMALDGDFFSPWVGNDTQMHFIRSFDPNAQIPQFDWDAGNKVKRSDILNTDDLLTAPNQFVVVSNGAATQADAAAAIAGFYDVPAVAPHSAANRGFVIPVVETRQISSQAQANAIAINLGQRQTIFERVELATAPDPRHDSYDVIHWQGENWLEIAWTLPLQEGSDMRHILRKAYSS